MIYFDNSATTKILPEVLDTYVQVSNNYWGNPSSLHGLGEEAFNLLNQSRQQIANLLKVRANEIIFTSGGSEGDNWIVKGVAMQKQRFGKHIITSSIEHPAIYNAMRQLEQNGFEVTYLPVTNEGLVSISALKKAIRKDTILVSIMAVNNEIGTIQPLEEITNVLKQYPSIIFHVDAVQALGKGLEKQIFGNDRIDFASFSGHKFHAPRGTGFIYKRSGKKICPLINGGGQEQNLRSGTENVPGIASMAKALRILLSNEEEYNQREHKVLNVILNHINKFKNVRTFYKNEKNHVPTILCFAILGVRGETIVHAFEEYGIYISTTSACSSKKGMPASTLKAMKIPDEISNCAVRISLNGFNTVEEAEEFNNVFDKLYDRFKKIN